MQRVHRLCRRILIIRARLSVFLPRHVVHISCSTWPTLVWVGGGEAWTPAGISATPKSTMCRKDVSTRTDIRLYITLPQVTEQYWTCAQWTRLMGSFEHYRPAVQAIYIARSSLNFIRFQASFELLKVTIVMVYVMTPCSIVGGSNNHLLYHLLLKYEPHHYQHGGVELQLHSPRQKMVTG